MAASSNTPKIIVMFIFLSICDGSPSRPPPTCTDDDMLFIGLLGFYLLLTFCLQKKQKRRRRMWVSEYLQGRHGDGRFQKDFMDMVTSPRVFRENFHMSPACFRTLLSLVHPTLKAKRNTRPGDAIGTDVQLAVTLEFLASGTMQRHLASWYRISKQHLGHIIERTCQALVDVLGPRCCKPFTRQNWVDIANGYHVRWNMPNCVGAVDGKHVAIKCPPRGASMFYNYKGFHSIVLMAVVDSKYRFLYVDIGAYGSEGDSTIFRESSFGRGLFEGRMNLPSRQPVLGKPMPFYFVADDAFPLTLNMMKPYKPPRGKMLNLEETTFNYRLSRARRCVENAFGILVQRWCCLAKTLVMKPDRVQVVVHAACMLHNFLMDDHPDTYCPPGFADTIDSQGNIVEGQWRNRTSGTLIGLNQQHNGRPLQTALEMRNHLKEYVCSPEGQLPWQPYMPCVPDDM